MLEPRTPTQPAPPAPRSLRVVSLHRADAVSGVSVAGARASCLPPPFNPWSPLIIGPALDPDVIRRTPLALANRVTIATWRPDADAVAQVLAVRAALRTLRADVVVPNDLPHGFIAAALEHHGGLRSLAWIHADFHDGDDLILRCGALADAWRAVSPRAAARAAAFGILPGAGGILPACVDVPDLCPPLRQDDGVLRLLYAGRLERLNKRVLDLVQLAEHLDRLIPSTRRFVFTIAGAGPAEDELRALAAPYVARGLIEFAGIVPLDRMPRLYANHDVTVLVSQAEAMPNVVMESLAAGRPVAITSGCGGALDLVRHGVEGWIANVGAMDALAAGLAEASRSSLARMGAAAHASARSRVSARSLGASYDLAAREAAAAPWRIAKHGLASIAARWSAILAALQAIGPCDPNALDRLRREWLANLGLHADTPMPVIAPRILAAAERLFLAAIDRLRDSGHTRIALYGAGRHTERLELVLADAPDVIAIVDDRAGQPGLPRMLFGRPVVPPDDVTALALDAIIISSDEHERTMLPRARAWARTATHATSVVGLYHEAPDARTT